MTITPTGLTRASGGAAIAAGLVFIGVQINHPHLDPTSIATTEMLIRGSFKVVMAALAIAGITGMYLRQVKQVGVLGLVGWLMFSIGYLLIMGTAFVGAFVLPSVAGTDPAYVTHVLAAATGRGETGDIGHLQNVLVLQAVTYLGGGLIFGIALFRARVLPRWAAALLAVSGLLSGALTVMPDAFYRLLAFPNAIAMIALGYALWADTRTDPTAPASDGSSEFRDALSVR
jgi:hypothetical protein